MAQFVGSNPKGNARFLITNKHKQSQNKFIGLIVIKVEFLTKEIVLRQNYVTFKLNRLIILKTAYDNCITAHIKTNTKSKVQSLKKNLIFLPKLITCVSLQNPIRFLDTFFYLQPLLEIFSFPETTSN